jgi:hypothetical protein
MTFKSEKAENRVTKSYNEIIHQQTTFNRISIFAKNNKSYIKFMTLHKHQHSFPLINLQSF